MASGLILLVAFHLILHVSTSTCPDNSTQCTTESTCCEVVGGHYGCCPIPNAVCCSDRQHCCPEGFKCIHDVCTRGNTDIAEVICPDGEHQCPDDMTCCKSSSNRFSCCPFPDAVCCSDGQHCCPGGNTCDVTQGKCLPTTTPVAMVLTPSTERVDDVPCSSTFSCPSGDTCCHVPSGAWGCCPLTDAVCCEDKVHCCPHGSECGPTGCQGVTTDIVNAFNLHHSAQPINSVVCPGGQYECPDQSTCCMLQSGAWGCCPLPNAVCCEDKIHCCPQGSECGPTGCQGMTPDIVNAFNLHHSAQPINAVVCPGGQYQCPDQSTCCMLPSGAWGCCPLPNAVCCDDHIHCCPSGYTCSLGICSQASGSSLPWVKKQYANFVL